MIPQEFVARWSKIQQKETAVSHSHFIDICQLVGHPIPAEYDQNIKDKGDTGVHIMDDVKAVVLL